MNPIYDALVGHIEHAVEIQAVGGEENPGGVDLYCETCGKYLLEAMKYL